MGGIASCEAKPKAKKPPPGPHEGPGSPISALGYQGVRLPGAVSTTQGQGEGPCATETRFSPVRRCPGHISHPAPPPRRRLTPCGHQTLSSCSQGRGRWRCSQAGAAGCQAGEGQKWGLWGRRRAEGIRQRWDRGQGAVLTEQRAPWLQLGNVTAGQVWHEQGKGVGLEEAMGTHRVESIWG